MIKQIATQGATVTPSDTTFLTNPGTLYVGVSGDLTVIHFDDYAGTPTAGAAVYFSTVIPPLSGANAPFPAGINFSTGIAITTTTGLADSDATGVALNDLIINIFYK